MAIKLVEEKNVEERIQKVLKEVFNMHQGTFADTDGPKEIEGWDSLKHLNLIMALQEEFGVEMGFEEMLEIQVIGDIRKILMRKLA